MTTMRTFLYETPTVVRILEEGDDFANDGVCMGLMVPMDDAPRIFIGQVEVEEGRLLAVGQLQVVLVHTQFAFDILSGDMAWERVFDNPDCYGEVIALTYTSDDSV